MSTPAELYHRARELGLTLKPAGDLLVIQPKGKCPPELRALLAEHKAELLAWLRSPFPTSPRQAMELPAQNTLPPDQLPWLHIAQQILAGEFDGCDSSTTESLIIGLRDIEHPLCRRALAALRPNR